MSKTRHSFDKPFTVSFYVLDGDNPASSIPNQTATGYLFEQRPSREDAFAGAGAVQTKTSILTSAQSIPFAFDAVNDPQPNQETPAREYWVVCKYKADSTGNDLIIYQSITLERPEAHPTEIDVTNADLLKYDPTLTGYLSTNELDAYIQIAIMEIKDDLESRLFRWSRIHNPNDLKLLVIYKAMSHAYMGQTQAPNDKWIQLKDKKERQYQGKWNSLKIAYESNNQQTPVTKERMGGPIYMVR